MKKVLLVTDLEGITGISKIEAVLDTASLEYQESCKRLIADTNTAVSALFGVGVETVYVVDGHGSGKNFPENTLDSRATQIWTKDLPWVIKEVCAVVMIGMHAMAGTRNAFLDHTQSSVLIHHYFYNDQRIGELSQMGVFAGHFGVPIVAVSGDKAACEEAKTLFNGIYTACVKEAVERNVAMCLPKEEAAKRIYQAVQQGYENRENIKPMEIRLPFTVKVEFNRADYCDNACKQNLTLERLDAYSVQSVKTKIENYLDVLL